MDFEYDEYCFSLDIIPDYLLGGEAEEYIRNTIMPQVPRTMSKSARAKVIKAKIKEEFRSEKGRPCWTQESEWPLGKNGKPCTYIGKGKSEGDLRRFRFRDETTGDEVIIEQFY